MIPSDHFTRFYNEVFKFLEERSEEDLQRYWLEISKHQARELIPLFKEKGFQGMKEYWDRIIDEENLEAETKVTDEYFQLTIHNCASLSKATDNDAGVMPRYCEHCGGWIEPIMKELGYFPYSDIISPVLPKCQFTIFAKREDFEKVSNSQNRQ